MSRRPSVTTLTDTLFPNTTHVRSRRVRDAGGRRHLALDRSQHVHVERVGEPCGVERGLEPVVVRRLSRLVIGAAAGGGDRELRGEVGVGAGGARHRGGVDRPVDRKSVVSGKGRLERYYLGGRSNI